MECREIDLEAIPSPEEDELDPIAVFEFEAAEALAGLARGCSAVSGRLPVAESDQPKATELYYDYATTSTRTLEKIDKIVEKTPSQFCNTSFQPNFISKSRPKLSEVEKEERKLRRILANRESARQTIRRRKAMHLELTRKAADVLEENKILKRKKEAAEGEYNSLKDKNEFLKAELAKIKTSKQGEFREEQTAASSENPCPASTSTQTFLCNQQPVVPCFWPPVLPSSESVRFQCAPVSNAMNPSHFPVPCTHQGQGNSLETGRQGTPFFVVAVPWLLPFLTHGGTADFQSCSNDVPQNESNQLSSSLDMNLNMEVLNSAVPTACNGCQRLENRRVDDSCGGCVSCTSESIQHGLFGKNLDPNSFSSPKSAEDVSAATLARRRRKELMRLKSVHCHYGRVHNSASG
ncbi:uncharacterized protein LOC127250956 [Andrographis paniculata]|uniref:uncharacterized protein LOC127250956 n=1 Tax=Andrographis paniculata TaxID=175694 RepID=UPI0021E8AEEC|nr:uncharacterized protein LOC127250956 [Andrographis paniculata]XP_051130416.1 uncharacterized protein LOC127250956 [Andrographis paniculata]XP_051130417.1 uncharacterized protein LOC127250956 [Andrographis paniculata]